MQITHTIDIDLLEPGSPQRIQVKQGDCLSRIVALRLYSGGESWPIPDGATAAVRYHVHALDGSRDASGIYDRLPDGTSAWEYSENLLHLTPLPEMFARHSIVFMDAALILEGVTIATCNFEFYVNPAPADGTEAAAQSYYRVVNLEQINQSLNAMRATVEASVPEIQVNSLPVGTQVNITVGNITKGFIAYNGSDGKSAYAYAAEGGYTGTEEEFGQRLAALMNG